MHTIVVLAIGFSAHRRPRPLRPGAPATLLRTTPLRPGAARAARRGPARLSLRQAAARWAHRAAAYAPGADRAPGRTDPAPTPAPPPLSRRAGTQFAASGRRSSLGLGPPARRSRLPRPRSTPSARRRASSGRCSWPASTRSCRCAAPTARGSVRIIAFLTEPRRSTRILTHLGEPTTPPELARARGPPLWDQVAEPVARWEDAPAPVPEYRVRPAPGLVAQRTFPAARPAPPTGLTGRCCRAAPKTVDAVTPVIAFHHRPPLAAPPHVVSDRFPSRRQPTRYPA